MQLFKVIKENHKTEITCIYCMGTLLMPDLIGLENPSKFNHYSKKDFPYL